MPSPPLHDRNYRNLANPSPLTGLESGYNRGVDTFPSRLREKNNSKNDDQYEEK